MVRQVKSLYPKAKLKIPKTKSDKVKVTLVHRQLFGGVRRAYTNAAGEYKRAAHHFGITTSKFQRIASFKPAVLQKIRAAINGSHTSKLLSPVLPGAAIVPRGKISITKKGIRFTTKDRRIEIPFDQSKLIGNLEKGYGRIRRNAYIIITHKGRRIRFNALMDKGAADLAIEEIKEKLAAGDESYKGFDINDVRVEIYTPLKQRRLTRAERRAMGRL